MSKPRLYVEGASMKLEDLDKSYKRLENSPSLAGGDAPDERPVSDPLGLKTPKKPPVGDPYFEAKEAAVRVTKFIALCAHEMGLAPEQIMFAVELSALNTFNAQDCPLKPEAIGKIREAAYQYYATSLKKIPDVR